MFATRYILTVLLLGVAASAEAEPMTITPMDSPEGLAEALVGDGVSIVNVSYTGSTVSSGYFSGGTDAGIGLESGIVLTTGDASSAGTLNTSSSTSLSLGNEGSPLLDSITGGYKTYDATVLSISFVSEGDSAYFNYVFASEEYVEYANSSFNDAFGFFIDDTNYALIGESSEPVTINNVNQDDNSALFNNNDPWHGGATAIKDVTYDGYTNAFTASLEGLTAGQVYTIDLAIADTGDHIYDSAVFIDAGSFSKAPTTPSGAPEPHFVILSLIAGASLLGYKRLEKQEENNS